MDVKALFQILSRTVFIRMTTCGDIKQTVGSQNVEKSLSQQGKSQETCVYPGDRGWGNGDESPVRISWRRGGVTARPCGRRHAGPSRPTRCRRCPCRQRSAHLTELGREMPDFLA